MISNELRVREINGHRVLYDRLFRANEIYMNFANTYSDVKYRKDFNTIISSIYNDENRFAVLAAGSDGRISYARKPEDRYNPNKKIRISFARYLRRVLKVSSETISDSDLQAFQEAFKLSIQSKKDLSKQIKILRGDDLVNYYRDTLIKSCMTGPKNSKKIQLYAINKDKVGLVTINNLVRGVIWNCDDGSVFIDKLYGHVLGANIIKDWALKNKYKIKDFIFDKDCYSLRVTLKMSIYTGTPCLDTFYYGKFVRNEDGNVVGVKVSSTSSSGYDVRFSDIGLIYH